MTINEQLQKTNAYRLAFGATVLIVAIAMYLDMFAGMYIMQFVPLAKIMIIYGVSLILATLLLALLNKGNK